jgi:ribonucleoside-diphosphate reductase alpha chain
MNVEMRVTKRNGELQDMLFDKILSRVRKLGKEANIQLNYSALVIKIIDQLYDGIQTTKIDELTAQQCASNASNHPDYNTLAGRIVVSNHHKNTDSSFSYVMERLYSFIDVKGNHSPLISKEYWDIVSVNRRLFDEMIVDDRDYLIDYFGFKTLERAYLFKIYGVVVERPQHLWLRVALGIHKTDLISIKETYDRMSLKYMTHATPTLFNACSPKSQLSSCYLLQMEDDSVDGIYNTLKSCAQISKYSGGIGLHINNIRSAGSHINGTNGKTNGIVPMLKVFNATAKFINQGGKRNGSFAIYLEPWHADIQDFLELKKNHGDEEMKARDLFYALWICDLFMDRVKADLNWSLFCPRECPKLVEICGEDFNQLYVKYETEGRAKKVISARQLWFQILDSQMETGTPYLLYKDSANTKSNQKNIGTIKSSNLCVSPETLVLTDKGHIRIDSLKDKNVNVWNGSEWSEVIVKKTGESQEVIKIYTDDGLNISCTPYHKFYIQRTYSDKSVCEVEANNLTSGDKLIKGNYPIIDGVDTMLYPYTHGFFCGDGGYRNITNVLEKFAVPFDTYSITTKLDWFAGYCDACGTISLNETDEQLQVSSINRDFLIKVKMMLQTCSINPKVELCGEEEEEPLYRLLVTSYDLYQLVQLGFHSHRLIITGTKPQRSAEHFVKILKVVNKNRISDTYCFAEPKRHIGIFNGILTGQCAEIIEYSDKDETAVCNLASIALPAFVNKETKAFDYNELIIVAKMVADNLNKIIDINYYPTEQTRISNMRHRPIGIGVQGLADTFIMMDVAFHSEDAKKINKLIFETIYFAVLTKSNELAMRDGPYSTFAGSPASSGILQFDMWNVVPELYDWTALKQSIQTHGLRNSLLVALMPTASTSQILGYNECFEPLTSNIYSRRTLAGEFVVANQYLMRELIGLGLWNDQIKNNIIENKGSIQQITSIPQHIRDKYKIVWEIPMKHIIDMSADRGAYVCQSQSLNLWMEDPNYTALTSMHFYAWKKGLKTGMYYLRRKAKHQAQQFTIEPIKKTEPVNEIECEMCSS